MSAEQIGIAVVALWLAISLARGLRRDLREGEDGMGARERQERRARLWLAYPFMAVLVAGLIGLILRG